MAVLTNTIRRHIRRSRVATRVESATVIDADFAPCRCPRIVQPTSGSRGAIEAPEGIALLHVVSLRLHVGNSQYQATFRCLSCELVWLVWRTLGPEVFWPTVERKSALRRVEEWPKGFEEVAVVRTRRSLRFVARVAVCVDNQGHVRDE